VIESDDESVETMAEEDRSLCRTRKRYQKIRRNYDQRPATKISGIN
jgi:hypothetical protein